MRVRRSGRIFEEPNFENKLYKVFLDRLYSNNLTFIETIIRSEDEMLNNVFQIFEKSSVLKKLAIQRLDDG